MHVVERIIPHKIKIGISRGITIKPGQGLYGARAKSSTTARRVITMKSPTSKAMRGSIFMADLINSCPEVIIS